MFWGGLPASGLVGKTVFVGEHTFMQDAGNQNPWRLRAIKYDVTSLFEAAQARSYVVTGSAQFRIVGKCLEARLKVIEIPHGLGLTPLAKRKSDDSVQIGFGSSQKAKDCHD